MSNTTLYFNELTIGDMMALLGTDNVCESKVKYLVHGTNLRSFYDELIKNESDYKFVREDLLDIEVPGPEIPKEMIDAIKGFLDLDSISVDDIESTLKRHFVHYLIQDKKDTSELDKEFEDFSERMFLKLKVQAADQGITLRRNRAARKKAARSRSK